MNIGNDVDILKHTRREEIAGGAVKLLLPGDLMPDGEPVVHMLRQASGAEFADWCNIVRGEYNARKDSAQAAKVSTADARDDAGQGHGAQDEGLGRADVAVQNPVPVAEEEMERLLNASLLRITDEIESLREKRVRIDARLEKLYVSSKRLERALTAYNEEDVHCATD